MSAGNSGYQGPLEPNTANAEVNAWAFIVSSLTGRYQTATLVEVLSCTNDGEASIVGFVDVQLAVNQIDGAGNATPNAIVHGLPYLRIQGGSDAIICDPKPGDMGMAMFASRDISSVKVNRGTANPGSRRRFDLSDAMYLGGWVNTLPLQYIRFHEDGIFINTPNDLIATVGGDMTATVQGNATATVQGNVLIRAQGTITAESPVSITMDTPVTYFTGVIAVQNTRGISGKVATFEGPVEIVIGDLTVDVGKILALANDVMAQTISLHNHVHSGVQPGGSDTGPPVP